MKKLYLLLTALIVSVAANAADWYLVGDSYGWGDNEYGFTATGTANEYSLTVDELKGSIKIKPAGEDNWDCFVSNGSELKEGVLYTTTIQNLFDGSIVVSDIIKNAKITINTQAVTIMVTGTVSTDVTYCIHGNITGVESWTDIDLEYKDGKWVTTRDFVAGSFGMKKNGGWLAGGGMTITEADKAYSFNLSGGDSSSSLTGSYTFIFDPTANTVTFQTFSGDVPAPTYSTVVISGQVFGGEWTDTPLTLGEDGKWTVSGNCESNKEFGMKLNGTWYGGNMTITEANKAYTIDMKTTSGGNSKNQLTGWYTITFDPAAGTLTFVPTQEVEDVISYAIKGTLVDGGGDWKVYPMTEGDNDNWSVELTVISGTQFGVMKMNQNQIEKGWYNSPEASTATLTGPTSLKLSGAGGTNFTCNMEGAYVFTFNPETEMFTVADPNEEPTPEPEYSYYLNGAIFYLGYATEVEMTVEDGIARAEAKCWPQTFNIVKKNGEEVVATYGPETNVNAADQITSWNPIQATESSLNWTLSAVVADPPGKDLTFSFNIDTLVLTITETTGVEDVEVDNTVPARYYNLQGVEVSNPHTGIFIEVRGSNVRKINVR